MDKQRAQEIIEKEFSTAEQARKIGNEGMVRVCARRAAGTAITFWLRSRQHRSWGVDAMGQLRSLQSDETLPPTVRDAAGRLTARITKQFTSAFPTDPLQDSRIIIDYLLRDVV